jgi:hypothetical protein
MSAPKSITATFGPFTLSFPALNKPDDKFGEPVYKADSVETPDNEAMKACQAVFKDAIKQFELDASTCGLPLSKETMKDPDDKSKKPKKIPTGKLILRAKSKRPPLVVDAAGNPIDMKKVFVNGGTRARIQGFLKPYDMSGKEGISFTLTGVQIIEMAERNGASFDAYEGGYVHDASSDVELNIGDDDDAAPEPKGDGGVLDI